MHHQFRDGYGAGVELGGREIARARQISGHSERIGKHPEIAELRLVLHQPLRSQVEDEQADHPDEGPGRRPSRGGEGEKDRRDDQGIRKREQSVAEGESGKPVGTEHFLVGERHQSAEPGPNGDSGHRQGADREGAGEAPEQIVEFPDPGGSDERSEPGLVVAQDDVRDEGRAHEQEQQRRDDVRHDDCVRGVVEHVPAAAGHQLAHGNVGKGRQEEEAGNRREERAPDLVTELERRDPAKHVGVPSGVARRTTEERLTRLRIGKGAADAAHIAHSNSPGPSCHTVLHT